MTGYLIRHNPEQAGTCIMTYLTQSDMRGWIPEWAINKGTCKLAPNLVDKLARVGPVYEGWKAKHNPEVKPWLSTEKYVWEKQ